jgi:hypothetical protein
VTGPTEEHGHTLDLVVSRETENIVTNCTTGSKLSNHYVVHFFVKMFKAKPIKTVFTTRKLNSINIESFECDLSSQFESHPYTNTDEIVDFYQKTITNTLDRHAPMQTIERLRRSRQPWYTNEIHSERRLRRKLERKWRKSKLDVHRQMYANQRALVNNMIDKAKQDYYKNELGGADTKSVFKTVNTLLNKDTKILPVHSDAAALASEFGIFFNSKVSKIYDSIESEIENNPGTGQQVYYTPDCKLTEFDVVSEEDIMNYIMKTPAKSCLLDPIPTWFLKQNAKLFVSIITDIVNNSLSTGIFPKLLKHALITPVIKKQTLNTQELKNYRPVSNIIYLSKIVERHAVNNISKYLTVNNLGEPLQSAYKPAHSTETALLKVKNDIMEYLSQRKGVFLALLDLSAAFDTVNHHIMLSRLSNEFGIQGTVLNWISSYLSERTTSVCISGAFSERLELKYGLPQGSIVGPQQFTIYTTAIGRILRKYNLHYHIYADDIQVYAPFDPNDHSLIVTVLNRMSACIDEIKSWMTENRLKFNDDKSEFFIAIPDHLKDRVPPVCLQIGNNTINPTASVRNLGVVFDQSLSMSSQITSLCTSLRYQLRNISRIRKFLDNDTCHLVVRALVLSRLDYGNALLYNSKTSDIQRLQRIQNWAAKLIHRALKNDHATPYLKELHWLPVRERITFKILVYVYKCINGIAPGYLSSCLSPYRPGRSSLRSALDTTRLTEPSTIKYLTSASSRTFSHYAPHIWNALPITAREAQSISIFKKLLKHHLYPQ